MNLIIFFLIFAVFSNLGYSERQRIPDFDISDEEIRQVARRLRGEDINKAKPSQIRLDFQGHTNSRDSGDAASKPLFATVDSSILRKPTFEKFAALLDNYNFEVGRIEKSDNKERQEIIEFIDAIFETRPWKILIDFLVQKKHPFVKDIRTFKLWIKQLWFEDYSRARGVADTSGFEHVFVGESKNGEVAGLHNWIRFFMLERNQSANFDYKGFIIKRFDVFAMTRYTWQGVIKRTGGFFVGTSPEFDMAIYTMCFLSRRGFKTCDFDLDGCPFSVTSYDMSQFNKVFIGTIYPSAGPMNEQCRNANRGRNWS
ncbi:hypothetical protein FO519_006358 [Halicephalobus sp. NKZ332]|nr:hypothetical protein FO519_006358 [Halicephalobus sp. NKZ332]